MRGAIQGGSGGGQGSAPSVLGTNSGSDSQNHTNLPEAVDIIRHVQQGEKSVCSHHYATAGSDTTHRDVLAHLSAFRFDSWIEATAGTGVAAVAANMTAAETKDR